MAQLPLHQHPCSKSQPVKVSPARRSLLSGSPSSGTCKSPSSTSQSLRSSSAAKSLGRGEIRARRIEGRHLQKRQAVGGSSNENHWACCEGLTPSRPRHAQSRRPGFVLCHYCRPSRTVSAAFAQSGEFPPLWPRRNCCNGDATSHDSFQARERNAYNGLVLVIVRTKKGEVGASPLQARSEGLAAAEIRLRSK